MSKPAPRCWRCGQLVTWLTLNGAPIAIESCEAGKGDIGIQRQIDGSEIAIVGVGTRHQRHSRTCKSPSYVATALAKKVRL